MTRKTYVWQDGKMVEKIPARKRDEYYVQDDIKPYKSMIDGSVISSRSQHRRHLKQHGCIEVGNERMENKPKMSKSVRREILREQLGSMTHREASRILDRIRDEIRFSNPHRK